MDVFYLKESAKEIFGTLADKASIMERKPVFEVRIGNFYVERIFLLSNVYSGIKPCFEAVFIYFFSYGLKDLNPRIKFILWFHESALDFHSFIHRCGKPSFG